MPLKHGRRNVLHIGGDNMIELVALRPRLLAVYEDLFFGPPDTNESVGCAHFFIVVSDTEERFP